MNITYWFKSRQEHYRLMSELEAKLKDQSKELEARWQSIVAHDIRYLQLQGTLTAQEAETIKARELIEEQRLIMNGLGEENQHLAKQILEHKQKILTLSQQVYRLAERPFAELVDQLKAEMAKFRESLSL